MTKTVRDEKQLELNLDAVSPTEIRSTLSSDTPSKLPESAPALHPPPEDAWVDLGYTRRGKKRR